MPEAVLDTSACARMRTSPAVRDAVLAVQRVETGVSARDVADHEVVHVVVAATALVHDAEVLHHDADHALVADAGPRLRTRWVVPRGGVA